MVNLVFRNNDGGIREVQRIRSAAVYPDVWVEYEYRRRDGGYRTAYQRLGRTLYLDSDKVSGVSVSLEIDGKEYGDEYVKAHRTEISLLLENSRTEELLEAVDG